MKLYLFSLAVGVLVGVIYGVLNVRSPAPPVVALVGLLGMLGGEQAVKLIRKTGDPPAVASSQSAAPQPVNTGPREKPKPARSAPPPSASPGDHRKK